MQEKKPLVALLYSGSVKDAGIKELLIWAFNAEVDTISFDEYIFDRSNKQNKQVENFVLKEPYYDQKNKKAKKSYDLFLNVLCNSNKSMPLGYLFHQDIDINFYKAQPSEIHSDNPGIVNCLNFLEKFNPTKAIFLIIENSISISSSIDSTSEEFSKSVSSYTSSKSYKQVLESKYKNGILYSNIITNDKIQKFIETIGVREYVNGGTDGPFLKRDWVKNETIFIPKEKFKKDFISYIEKITGIKAIPEQERIPLQQKNEDPVSEKSSTKSHTPYKNPYANLKKSQAKTQQVEQEPSSPLKIVQSLLLLLKSKLTELLKMVGSLNQEKTHEVLKKEQERVRREEEERERERLDKEKEKQQQEEQKQREQELLKKKQEQENKKQIEEELSEQVESVKSRPQEKHLDLSFSEKLKSVGQRENVSEGIVDCLNISDFSLVNKDDGSINVFYNPTQLPNFKNQASELLKKLNEIFSLDKIYLYSYNNFKDMKDKERSFFGTDIHLFSEDKEATSKNYYNNINKRYLIFEEKDSIDQLVTSIKNKNLVQPRQDKNSINIFCNSDLLPVLKEKVSELLEKLNKIFFVKGIYLYPRDKLVKIEGRQESYFGNGIHLLSPSEKETKGKHNLKKISAQKSQNDSKNVMEGRSLIFTEKDGINTLVSFIQNTDLKNILKKHGRLGIFLKNDKVLSNLVDGIKKDLLENSSFIKEVSTEVQWNAPACDLIFILSVNRDKSHWNEIGECVDLYKENDTPVIVIKGMQLEKFKDHESLKKLFWARDIPETTLLRKEQQPFKDYAAVFWFDVDRNDKIILSSQDNTDEMEQLMVFIKYLLSSKTDNDKEKAINFFEEKLKQDDKFSSQIRKGRKLMISKRIEYIKSSKLNPLSKQSSEQQSDPSPFSKKQSLQDTSQMIEDLLNDL